MERCFNPKRWSVLALVVVLGIFAGLRMSAAEPGATTETAAKHDWPMFGGTPQRNMVNTVDKNVPITWNVTEGAQKNVKWVAQLGTQAYLPPAIAGGKVFV